MADTKVDSVILEIAATTDKADGGIDKVIKSLSSMQKATEGIDADKLTAISNALKGFAGVGDQLKNAGAGMRGIVSSIKSMAGIDTEKLKNVAETIEKIGNALGNLGSNNKISIKIDSEGIKKAVEPLEEVRASLEKKGVMEPYKDFEKRLRNVGKDFSFSGDAAELDKEVRNAEAQLDSLLQKEEKMKNVDGLKQNSKAYRSLQYDIAGVCNKLDILYEKMEKEKTAAVNATEPYERFEERLKSVGKDYAFHGGADQLATEIQKAEAKLDGLLAKEEKLKTTEGIDKDSAGYRSLQYDIAAVCNKLDALYAKLEQEAAASTNAASMYRQVQDAMNNAASSAERLSAAEDRAAASGNSAAAGQQAFNDSLNQTNADSANTRIQALIAQINQYKATISGMESGKVLFDTSQYEEAVNGLRQVQEQFRQFKESITDTPKTMEDISKSISSIGAVAQKCGLGGFSSILNNIAAILPSISAGSIEASAGFQSMAVGLQAIQSAVPIIGIILTVISALINAAKKAGNALKDAFQKASDTVKGFASKTKQAVAQIISKFEELKKKIKDFFGVHDKSVQNFVKKLKSLSRLGTFMLLRKAFTYLFKFIGEGFDNLVLYSDKFATEFSKNVSTLYSDLKWLGNAFATAFEPILNYIAPMLDLLVSKIVSVCNALAQFFAALTGKSTWTRAKKLNEDYAKSIDKSKKSVMGLADGIDELHNLNEKTDSSDGTTDPGDMFETLPVDSKFKDWAQKLKDAWNSGDFTDIGKWLGDKLAEMLANIDWDKIKAVASKLGRSLATLINGFIQGSFDGKSVSWWIGHTLAEALNTAFTSLYNFAKNLDWKGVGKAISDLFIGFFDSIDWPLIKLTLITWAKGLSDMFNEIFSNTSLWEKAGNFFSQGINSIIQAALLFLRNFDAKEFGSAMGTFLSNAIAKINFSGLGMLFSLGVKKIFEAIQGFLETFDFDELADRLSKGINNAFNLDWETIRTTFGNACTKLGAFVKRMLVGDENGEGGINWGQIGKDLMAAVVTVIEGIGNFFAEQDPEVIGSKIGEFVNSAFSYLKENQDVITTSINNVISTLSEIFDSAIDEIDWETIFGTIGEIVSNIKWSELFGTAFEAIAGAWTFEKIFKIDTLNSIGESIWGAIADGIDNAMQNIADWLGEHVGEKIKAVFEGIFGLNSEESPYKSYGENVVEGLKQGIKQRIPGMQTFIVSDFAKKICEWFCGELDINSPSKVFESYGEFTVQGFLNGIDQKLSDLKTAVSNLGTNIVNWFKDKLNSNTLVNIGKNVIQGFTNGLNSMYSSLKSSVENMANNVSSWFKSKLQIHSPSRLFYSFGEYTVEGFNNAIENMSGTTKEVVDSWSESFGDMRANVGFTVDYSGLDNYSLNDGSDFVVNATKQIQSNIDTTNNDPNSGFDYDAMGYVYKEALREIMTQIIVPAIENVKSGNEGGSYKGNMGLLKAVQEQAEVYRKTTGTTPFPA